MITFIGGPADGKTLVLRRAPLFLRVVEATNGSIDALDQVDDNPIKSERLIAYRRVKYEGSIHLHMKQKGRDASGWYVRGSYEVCEQQPSDTIMRSTQRWQEWATREMMKEKV